MRACKFVWGTHRYAYVIFSAAHLSNSKNLEIAFRNKYKRLFVNSALNLLMSY